MIQGSTKIGHVMEVTTSFWHGRHGVEIRIWSLSGDNTHSWVRIFHGSNKFVMDSNNNDTEVPEDQLEEHALQLDAKDFACRSKEKAKPQRRESAESSSRIILVDRRHWIDIEPEKLSLCIRNFEESNSSSSSFSPSTSRRGWSGSLLEKENLQNQFPQSIHWSDDRWKACSAAGGGAKRRFQYCTDDSGIIILFPSSSRTFRTQSY